jgi:hypothetical protein
MAAIIIIIITEERKREKKGHVSERPRAGARTYGALLMATTQPLPARAALPRRTQPTHVGERK